MACRLLRHQAIIRTIAEVLSIGPSASYFSEIYIKIQQFSFKEINLEMSAKCHPLCLSLNVLGKQDILLHCI